ncbi:uncharacterized protein LOC100828813 isoform X2 [Brachypodium distachyon]|uniref:uncharacterized protein LOC100828813 isoform X2 n=1 Tax=Brachypodium distachyon TaxID=15368 RepID=UPI000D0E1801|nr:uncharacterized protein LOC100828813 isoform X2 [Brachypodium distachyon]|eukprot:XP_024317261.1 uncharacterized protein LOC100828813 isoform X2 [Brachypodium distachyon]
MDHHLGSSIRPICNPDSFCPVLLVLFFFFFLRRILLVFLALVQCSPSAAWSGERWVISGLGRRDQDTGGGLQRPEMFATAARWVGKKGKPKMGPIELTAAPEQAQSITRTIFDVVREHGPLTITDVWEHVKPETTACQLSTDRQDSIMSSETVLEWIFSVG